MAKEDKNPNPATVENKQVQKELEQLDRQPASAGETGMSTGQKQKPLHEKRWRVAHNYYGPFPQGRVIDYQAVKDVVGDHFKPRDLQHGISNGALVEVEEPLTQTPLEPGPENPAEPPKAEDDEPTPVPTGMNEVPKK